ncbi:electron transport complex subunit RsxG [Alteromonas sp. D210916BOD_24]|uniref:electron transport complex subunit RsxG n=1 Tax=Alteromonas sp. D210916BOD_24 TaxID=3157618 RepID=UPI00399CFC83
MMRDSLLKNGAMLGVFAVVTTALIALTFFGTQDRIEHQKKQKLLSVLNDVVPERYHDNPLYANCTLITAKALGSKRSHKVYRATLENSPSALVLEATAPNGYSGNIDLVIGVSIDMTVLGVRVIEHKETPGLGDKVELAVSDWITSFTGKAFSSDNTAPWYVKKDGGEFDQFTGATITPRAVVGAVRRALVYAQAHQADLFSADTNCGTDVVEPTTTPQEYEHD